MSAAPLIGIVGPCKAGKSTLAAGLQAKGYNARTIAQEHSFAPSMWQRISDPELLIFLNCEFETTKKRGLSWLSTDYEEQQRRLAHAREFASLLLETDVLTPEEILQKAIGLIDFELKHKPPKE